MSKIAIVLLAAGESRRMGTPKQLADFYGKPLLRHAAEIALASVCRPVVVVTGSASERIASTLDELPVITTYNARWQEGMGTSIQAGLAALPPQAEGAILALGDQPMLTAEHYNALVARQVLKDAPIVAARYANTVGVPALFMRPYFAQLERLAPAQGCKSVILANDDVAQYLDIPDAEHDADTPPALADIRRAFAARFVA